MDLIDLHSLQFGDDRAQLDPFMVMSASLIE